ncbi:MAG: phosphoenolpyruvate--protein phosphotransferase [Liquorilactobacillus nagelii]|jgi:phosphotransferase system enzyme I (PtsI)|uniref:Phosphoenolpyruvate-protein phosphotransferase n=1 Tax=Liquorilactobacillus nagelii TaxID=82688 RepID=A0A3Q8CPF7_9LACO|nr:phosphoenolpyruvate--protein phosphotransferase [Liquorilactobacillus nagelii]AUJ32500.1 phosphoenolpyruvate--protein phosphotransferase [Liquorilactobacillus nagelii]MCC7617109.1 phosphoenolpyruvate--protein phosphotransferase [Liquorilactobacillus nagelii]MCI1634315.1 phosphoenolpyruvate--protein phosphotransferase [Liquorilactobacillus nagelii]MCI1700415.1 phosphoenolpyruvate--protein phosphotransferase [Liquorilactobacillus nagelii]MCI1922284.1 phosphoenolpyruvate--protein phosphotransf
MTKVLKGIAASDGVAVAKAYMLVQPDLTFQEENVEDPTSEIARLNQAVADSEKELQLIKEKATANLGEAEAAVFEAHLTILADPEFFGKIKSKIKDEKVNAEKALQDVATEFISIFENMTDNKYMQERAGDIRDVCKRVLAHLLGVKLPNPALINEEVVIVAHDLTPSDTAQLDRKYVKGFITDIGGRTSHSAIMSRTLEIPAVVGSQSATKDIEEGQLVIIDGIGGEALVEPTKAEIEHYHQKAADFAKQKAEWKQLKSADSLTADGKKLILGANIGTPKDVVGATDNGAEAVGLFRSEFLYMDASELPTEDDQFEAYKKAVEGMNGKQVVIRTMDIGGDKELPYLPLPDEMNPFLGYRAIRISLDRQDIFRTQLRALLRASHYGKLAIMFPMIATVKEFKAAKAIYEEEKAKLVKAGVPVADDVEVGMMMEIPAAAMIADKLAKYADFFSIGTNDLIQYSMAADRGNERVSYLYQPYNPSILRLIKNIIEASHAEGKWTGMCGEMAGDQIAVPLLVGLGLDEFSMSATSILKTRSLMKKLNTAEMKQLAQKAVTECETTEEVVSLVKNLSL